MTNRQIVAIGAAVAEALTVASAALVAYEGYEQAAVLVGVVGTALAAALAAYAARMEPTP